jgi:hypothetical protein
MENVKKGDFITNADGSVREEVVARLEDLLFTRVHYSDGQKSAVMGPTHIDDAVGRGFGLETEAPASEGAEQ